MVSLKKWILPALLVVLILFLFVGGPGNYSSRIFILVWDLGHILLFLLVVVLLFRLPFVTQKKLPVQILLVFSIAIFFAVLTELLQSGINRTPALTDVRKDILGAFIGSLIVYREKYQSNKTFRVLTFITVVVCGYEIHPLVKTLVDEYDMLKTKSILSNLEARFEDERWKGNSEYKLSSDYVLEGKRSLKVTFNTDEYNSITLKYMYRDWSGKNSLHWSIYYLKDDILMLNVRINDYFHLQNNNRYNDRFNKEIFLAKGWNHIKIPIDDIENSPQGRKTNIKNMQSIGMFVTNLSEPSTIYIDNVYLD